MPTFTKGDYVKKGDSSGSVISQAGQNVTWKTTYGKVNVDLASSLEKNEGIGAYVSAQGPNLIETTENAVVFAAINGIMGKGFFGKESLRFLGQDLVYELFGKSFVRPYLDGWVDMSSWIPISKEEDRKSFIAMSDLADSIQKGVTVFVVIDSVHRLIMKESQTSSGRFYYALKGLASFYVSNVYERMMSTNLPFTPQ